MTPRRTSPTGSFRIRRDLTRFGLGELHISSRTTKVKEYNRRCALVDKLIEQAQGTVLARLKQGPPDGLTIERLVDADRHGLLTGASILTAIALREPLWGEAGAVARLLRGAGGTQTRYRVAFAALARKGAAWLPADARVGDLETVEWSALAAAWGASGSDWNNLRRAVSRLLSLALGDTYHPTRRAIVKAIPIQEETERVPDLDVAAFHRIVAATAEPIRPVWWALALTGMRVRSEYLRCTRAHLMPNTLQLRVPGTKTRTSRDVVSVTAAHWPWLDAAIPAPLQYKALRKHWTDACAAAGVAGVTLHDLRHVMGQLATDQGVPERSVQTALRHATPAMTRRYTKRREARDVAEAVSTALGQPGAESRPVPRPVTATTDEAASA